jgi:hypothetical protein
MLLMCMGDVMGCFQFCVLCSKSVLFILCMKQMSCHGHVVCLSVCIHMSHLKNYRTYFVKVDVRYLPN